MNPVGYLETGVLVCDDNLHALAQLPPACVDLIYLDPPFFSNRSYEVIWGDEAEVRSFEDRWEGGIQVYLDWMEDRLRHLHRVLKPSGSLYLHCDATAGHYLKVLMDSIFGIQHFVNEVIWKRTGAHSAKKGYGPSHDMLLLYARSADFYWEKVRGPYDPEYIATKFTMRDSDGRRFQAITLTPPGTRGGETGKPWRGIDPTVKGYHWKYPPSRLDELDAEGMIYWPKKENGMPRLKFFLDKAPGMLLQDVWTDIAPLNSRAAERLGYPTQKPEALLERVLRSSSAPGHIVLDPFCGCGTTMAVAEKLQRQWIGIDISQQAVEIVKARLSKLGATPTVHGLATSVEELRRLPPFEFQHRMIQRVIGTPSARNVADMGIDGRSFFENLPIQVKQSERVGRNVVDNFETAVERDGKHKGYVIAFSYTRGAYEEAARSKRQRGIEIVLVKVEDIVLVGDLIDSADREGRPPDLSRVSPDLMGLFRALQAAAEEREVPPPPPPDSKPSASELFASARRKREAQQRLAVQ